MKLKLEKLVFQDLNFVVESCYGKIPNAINISVTRRFIEALLIRRKFNIHAFDNKNEYPLVEIFKTTYNQLYKVSTNCIPYWNNNCIENTQKLWLPENINFTNKNTIIQRYKTNQQRHKLLLPDSNKLKSNEFEDVKTVKRMKKFRIYPTQQQKDILRGWFGTYRYIYNKMVSISKNPYGEYGLEWLYERHYYLDFFELRDWHVTRVWNGGRVTNTTLNDWEFNTPKHIRANAIKTFTTALKTNIKKIRKFHSISKFCMRYKSKKNNNQMIGGIEKDCIEVVSDGFKMFNTFTDNSIFKVKSRTKKELRNFNIEGDSIITFNGVHYHILIPYNKKTKQKKERHDIIALDPGVRTFQTGYSEKEVLKASSRQELIRKLYNKIDAIKSNVKKKSRKRRGVLKYENKIKNIVNDIHYKTVNYLINNYNDVLLPEFDSQDMVQGHLSKITKRHLNTLRHYRFKQRLLDKCKEIKNFRVFIVNESYTTKTCSNCGNLKEVGSSKIYNCSNCNVIFDRDINGARGILLKHLSL